MRTSAISSIDVGMPDRKGVVAVSEAGRGGRKRLVSLRAGGHFQSCGLSQAPASGRLAGPMVRLFLFGIDGTLVVSGVGGTPLDVASVRPIGACCVAVATGGVPATEPASHQPDWMVKDLREFPAGVWKAGR